MSQLPAEARIMDPEREKHPSLTAYNEETEGHRIIRLAQVIGYLYAKNRYLPQRLSNLHDHKGNLSVSWNMTPTPTEIRLVHEAWASEIGDGNSDSIDHFVNEVQMSEAAIYEALSTSKTAKMPTSGPNAPEAYRYRIVYLIWNTGTEERVAVGVCYQERGQPARLYWTRRREPDPRRAAFSALCRDTLVQNPATEECVGPQTVLGPWRYVESMPAIPLERWVASILRDDELPDVPAADAMTKKLAEALRIAIEQLEHAHEVILNMTLDGDAYDREQERAERDVAELRELLAEHDARVTR